MMHLTIVVKIILFYQDAAASALKHISSRVLYAYSTPRLAVAVV